MKKMMMCLAFLSFTAPAMACSQMPVTYQIVNDANFEAKIQNMDSESNQRCKALALSDGIPALDIKYVRSDVRRTRGTIERDFRAHLLCTSNSTLEPFYDYVEGKVTIEYRLHENNHPGDSCNGMVFENVKLVEL